MNPDKLAASFQSFGEEATRAAVEELNTTSKKAAADIRYIIRESHTETGRKRAEAGAGEAGRVKSGDMLDMVSHRVTHEGSKAVGEFGWLDGDIADYYRYQDQGTGRIEGMNAIFQAWSLAIGDFKRRLAQKGLKVE